MWFVCDLTADALLFTLFIELLFILNKFITNSHYF